jgi:glutamine cyclotransferase
MVRLSAGRDLDDEREMQALCFLAGANSIFVGGKLLTTPNPEQDEDAALFVTWQGGRGFVWNPDDLSAPIGEFSYAGEGWGLTTDGTSLILSDGTPVIRFLDPETFAVTRQMTVTFRGQEVRRLNELEWVDGQILANLWQQDLIARIDPATGEVVGVIDLADLYPAGQSGRGRHEVLNGIAWDAEGRRLFVTGKNWPHLFEIRLVPAEAPPA